MFSIGHYADILIDIGREMYYPKEILEGKILYKDLFCIYGPFSYLFNAFFYKLFGAKLSTLYVLGFISALLTVGLTYKISRLFLGEIESFSIGLFLISAGIMSTRIFNLTLPYSYAILYGLIFYLLSIYFMAKKRPILSSIFLGLSISNKYDFILGLIPFLIYKKPDLKSIIGFLGAFSTPFIILFIQGLGFSDLINAFNQIKDFTNTNALKDFYITQGVYYTNRLWLDWFFKFLSFSILAGISYFGFLIYEKNKPVSILLFLFTIYLAQRVSPSEYLFLTFLVLILFIFNFRKNEYFENIFILSALLISLKSLWGISALNYGLYYIGVILISFLILLKDKKLRNSIILIIFAVSFHYFQINAELLSYAQSKIQTKTGRIYTTQKWAEVINPLIERLQTDEINDVMIFPEGLSINFLADKKAKGYYSSLIPLYTEGFGEKNIIEYYKANKPDYIVFSNQGMESYNEKSICLTYAVDFCQFVYKNYSIAGIIKTKDDSVFELFRKR